MGKMNEYVHIEQFLPVIMELSPSKELQREDLLTERFLLHNTNDLQMYYAPHNDYVNTDAEVVIFGITPGWQQMKKAMETARQAVTEGEKDVRRITYRAKQAASFAGPLRANLIAMLNDCGLPMALQIRDSAELFAHKRPLLHTTSLLKYPVFKKGNNYTGHQPPITSSPLLRHYAYDIFPSEIESLRKGALIIPLGKAADGVIRNLLADGRLSAHTILEGFPHPSGANGHRQKQFTEGKVSFQKIIRQWAEQKRGSQ